jgi:Zn-finger nucleic acid-binding protein
MHRVNFGRCSSVVVDVCKTHGTWFDRDELRRVVEFIRAGGLDKARAKEFADLKEQEWRSRHGALENAQPLVRYEVEQMEWTDAISAVAGVLGRLLR